MTAAYLERLNPDQRRAVEFGLGAGNLFPGPLLVIAGAGSGKTNTIAHRVAHLLVNGADPDRILLMTFSRRAASDLTRRAEAICRQVMGERAGILAAGLPWAGTFHSIGVRLLRDYADQIGLMPDFSIHDREDSADLMNLARDDLGYSRMERRFPTKATCLEIYSRVVNSGAALADVLKEAFPWCASWDGELRTLFAAYVDAKQAQGRARFRRPAALLGADAGRPGPRGADWRALRSRAGG
jgi:DNA helicase-2/ATP-dependent DNA helicase PcrA